MEESVQAVPRGELPRSEVMQTPEEVTAMLRLKALGWGVRRIAEELGDALKWETSRGGALFPHLYGPLRLAAVRWVQALQLDDDGRHVLPPLDG